MPGIMTGRTSIRITTGRKLYGVLAITCFLLAIVVFIFGDKPTITFSSPSPPAQPQITETDKDILKLSSGWLEKRDVRLSVAVFDKRGYYLTSVIGKRDGMNTWFLLSFMPREEKLSVEYVFDCSDEEFNRLNELHRLNGYVLAQHQVFDDYYLGMKHQAVWHRR